MRARIYQPARTAMSSGYAKSQEWTLEYFPEDKSIDPLMGWSSSGDTQSQVRLSFETKEAALAYAAQAGIEVSVQEPKLRAPNIRPGGYGDNFSTGRKGAWTH